MDYFASTLPCALDDFARSFGSTCAHVLARNGCTLTNIACRVEWVQRYKIPRTFSCSLGHRSSTFSSSFADICCTASDIATWAALLRLGLGG